MSYTLPTTGEIIPMLQITPSKTDKERILVISPELAAVFAEIIHRVRDGDPHLPLVSRYDGTERVHSTALPFLFQRRWGIRDIAINPLYVKQLLDDLVTTAGITNSTDGSPPTGVKCELRATSSTWSMRPLISRSRRSPTARIPPRNA